MSHAFIANIGVERCLAEMLQYWLDTIPTASWQEVAAALEQVDLITLASRVKQKYLWDHAPDDTEGMLV